MNSETGGRSHSDQTRPRPVVLAHGLQRFYRQGEVEVRALAGVDLTLERGEFAALAGPSGSGKSTLLNLIGCLDTPTGGTLELDGTQVSRMSRTAAAVFRLQRIGFIFQSYNLVPVLTAYENAEFTLLLQGKSKAERRRRVEPLLRRVGLGELMRRRPHEMSGGQQQRVAVVRAIASMPSIILADEPTANLDTKSAGALLDLMEELNEEHGITFLLASHDPQVLGRVRRVVQLRDGEIISDALVNGARTAVSTGSSNGVPDAEPPAASEA